MLLLELDEEHFPVVLRIEVVGKQDVYLLIEGQQSLLCILGADFIYYILQLQNEFVLMDNERSLGENFGILLFYLILQLLVHHTQIPRLLCFQPAQMLGLQAPLRQIEGTQQGSDSEYPAGEIPPDSIIPRRQYFKIQQRIR